MRLFAAFVSASMLSAGAGLAAWHVGLPALQSAAERVAEVERAPQQVTLDPFVIPAIEGGRALFLLTVSLQVEVSGLAAEARLRDGLPRLRDAFVTELIGLYALELVRRRGDNLYFLRQRLLAASARALGDGVVSEIHFKAVERG